ncbi:MAG: hypothetical protein ACYTEQ_30915 [Planctomycetota bacterium]|jgi:hypothetical protein
MMALSRDNLVRKLHDLVLHTSNMTRIEHGRGGNMKFDTQRRQADKAARRIIGDLTGNHPTDGEIDWILGF